jgi:hypothetical protein
MIARQIGMEDAMPFPSEEQLKAIAVEASQKMAQMITLDKNGALTGRSLGARINPDWSIDIATFKQFARTKQVRRNPNIMFIWTAAPEQGAVQKVVFAKGKGEVISGDAVGQWYAEFMAKTGRQGMTAEQAAEQLDLIHFTPSELRFEGYAAEGATLTQEEVRTGYTIKF